MVVHSGSKQYSCPICDKAFGLKCNLLRHIHTHSGIRKHVCDLCKRPFQSSSDLKRHMDHVKRIWYLSPMRVAKVQASLRIRAVSPEPLLLAHTSSESSGTFRQKARSLAPLNGWACAVKVCHDGMLEDTNSLDGAHILTHTSEKSYKCDVCQVF